MPAAVKEYARSRDLNIVNEILSDLLEKTDNSEPYHDKSYPMGLKAGKNLDNIGELLAVMEGEDHRRF